MVLTYAVGDIHGMRAMLEEAFAVAARDAGGRPYRFVTLGDYVDRGPDSRGVVALIRRGPMDPSCRDFVPIFGNHDQMFCGTVLGDPDPRQVRLEAIWWQNGGRETLRCYPQGKRDVAAVEDARFLRDACRPVFVDDEGRIFVHAGLRPGLEIAGQDEEDMRWIRGPFLNSDYDFGGVVIHGHTIGRNPVLRANRVGLDTGAFLPDGHLTLARFDEGMPWPDRCWQARHAVARPVFKAIDLDVEAVPSAARR